MEFPKRLAALCKEKNLTQQALADKIKMHVIQIRRYEAGELQPILDVIRKLAIAFNVSVDVLIFDEHERDPEQELRLQFEGISMFSKEEKRVAKTVLEGLILKHEAKRWDLRRLKKTFIIIQHL
jgi:transcriptional regulator with XRE-family HTH domain